MTIQTTADRFLPPPIPQHDAMELTDHGQTALIRLRDQIYTLRITRQGKLILTK